MTLVGKLEEFSLVPFLTLPRDENNLGMSLTISSLLAALWFQFAYATSRRRIEYRNCLECEAFFEV